MCYERRKGEKNCRFIESHSGFFLTFLSSLHFIFFRADLGSQKTWGEDTKISHIALALQMHEPPPPSSTPSTKMVHLLQLMNLNWHITVIPSPQFTLWFSLAIYPMGLDKRMMTHIQHYGTKQSIFSALEILCIPFMYLYLNPWQLLNFLTVSTALSFSEYHIVGLIG